ncbi:MAG: nitrite/sulfite reductase, partial [Candidatus Electrothrix sp. AR3]|nr:nitrite/sulfite reductase [Candidatus Electrothrix sp. AR3]
MVHYIIPSSLDEDISCFENDFAEFKAGRLHEIAFTAKRVKMGVYLERNYTTYMCRIRCTGNIITPKQLAATANLAQQYGDARVHVTTRAEIQIHNIKDKNILLVLRELKKVGLSCQGGGGNTIRNIITNHDSGTCSHDVFDVQPCVLALTNRLIAEPDSWELPRKIKIAFSSREEEAALCLVQDIGFVASLNAAGEKGFAVYVGGGLGAKPKLAVLLQEFIAESEAYHVVRAIKNLYHSHGNRKNKHRNRIKFLLHDQLGEEKFRQYYQEEMAKVIEQGLEKLELNPIDNNVNIKQNIVLQPVEDNSAEYTRWQKRHVLPQQQQGLCSIRLPLFLGDLAPEDCLRLAEFLQPFGENTLRCGMDQNLYLRNIQERFLPNLYQVIMRCKSLSDKPVLYGNLVPCTGAQTCQVGLNRPRPAVEAILKTFDQTDFQLPSDLFIRISGCPNSCANHWLGDLAFFGKVRHVQGHPIPTYNVLGNGGINQGRIRLAEQVGWVHSFDLPEFITAVMRMYAECKAAAKDLDFYSYWNQGGKEAIADLASSTYNAIPSFAQDKNYYFDHGA